jgi:hypothetical protein
MVIAARVADSGGMRTMPPPNEAVEIAATLRTAAERLRAETVADVRSVPLREVFDDVARALGELADTSEDVMREYRVAAPGELRASSELVRRGDELTSSLYAARRNAELVCRHAPRRRDGLVAE